jgi:phage FluMu gp28-like protein
VYQQSRIAFDRMKAWLRQSDPLKRVWKSHDTEMWVELASGSRIWFKSGDDPDNLYGEDVYGAVLDEATRMREESWHAVRSTLTATRAPVRIIGNVRGRRNWVHRLAQRAQSEPAGDIGYHRLTAWDAVEGGVIRREEVEAAQRDLPAAVFKELYLAEPSDDGGNPFGIEAIAKCVRPDAEGAVAVWGVDLAKSQDWTVAVGLDVNGSVVALERWQGQWADTKTRLVRMIGETPALIDSTGVGDPIVEDLQRDLPNVEGFKFTAPSKQQLMEGLAAAIQQGRIGIPDGWLRSELEAFGYEHTRTGVRYEAPAGLHDDGVCALALSVRHLAYARSNTLDIRIF